MNLIIHPSTIEKTLLTALLIDGFWDRWVAHGVEDHLLRELRANFVSLERWQESWSRVAANKVVEAKKWEELQRIAEAEHAYRIASLYYNLLQWIYPSSQNEKKIAYEQVLECTKSADKLSHVETIYDSINIDGLPCAGRIRMTPKAKGVVIIINPIDSTKEELFSYEDDFVNQGFVTVSFDGPGQGQSYILNGLKGSIRRWEMFLSGVIDYANNMFSNLELFLFGTSSGGAWAIYGSSNKLVKKVVAVSPAISTTRPDNVPLPDYFVERLSEVLESGESIIPSYRIEELKIPILFFHGKRDVLVCGEVLKDFYYAALVDKQFIEYEEEGHCCNFELLNVRKYSVQWYLKERSIPVRKKFED